MKINRDGIFLFDKVKQSFDENLANAIHQTFGPRKAVDLGCGLGRYCAYLTSLGWEMTGIEGANVKKMSVFQPIYRANLNKPVAILPTNFVICLEVAEHVPSEKDFLSNLFHASRDWLILSWAVRGQGGVGHVNCKDNHEVIELLQSKFKHKPEISEILRKQASLRWFKNSLMVFRRKNGR